METPDLFTNDKTAKEQIEIDKAETEKAQEEYARLQAQRRKE